MKAMDELIEWLNAEIEILRPFKNDFAVGEHHGMERALFKATELNKSEWVSVSERLPEEELEGEQLILVLQYNDGVELVICGYYENGVFFNLETGDTFDNVIKWRELPTN